MTGEFSPTIEAASPERPLRWRHASTLKLALGLGSVWLLAGCAVQPERHASLGSRLDPRLGVSASERVVFGDDPVPRGGGGYLVGHPYVIAGRTYYPSDRVAGYTAVGTASWYGDAFHGRRTANGEVFDRMSISAAHPTLPLPSYVRVTNLGNGRSMMVRVNDRGPYHGGRVMDVSQRVADALDFRRSGTARIRIDYVGRAGLEGSDDSKLLATLRTDGEPADTSGFGGPTRLAAAPPLPARPAAPSAPAEPVRVARETPEAVRNSSASEDGKPATQPVGRLMKMPLPPARPFQTGSAELPAAARPGVPGKPDQLALLLRQH